MSQSPQRTALSADKRRLLAQLLKEQGLSRPDAADLIARRPQGVRLPLSFAQQRLWFLTQLAGASEAYHMPQALELTGELDRTALGRALDALVARHEALRTRFGTDGGEGYCLIEPGPRSAARSGRGPDRPGRRARCSRTRPAAPFDLGAGPLVRGRLLVLAPDRHVLLLTLHHIVSDGWSMGSWSPELGALYAAFRDGRTIRCRRWPSSTPTTPPGSGEWLAATAASGERVLAERAGRRAGAAGTAHRPAPAAGAGLPRRRTPAGGSTPS